MPFNKLSWEARANALIQCKSLRSLTVVAKPKATNRLIALFVKVDYRFEFQVQHQKSKICLFFGNLTILLNRKNKQIKLCQFETADTKKEIMIELYCCLCQVRSLASQQKQRHTQSINLFFTVFFVVQSSLLWVLYSILFLSFVRFGVYCL